jgi:hypothetical protein
VKLYIRLLLTIPFVFVAFGYYKTYNPDEGCLGGLFDQLLIVIFISVLLLTGILAIVATSWKRQSEKSKFEPITLSISLITFLFLIYDMIFRGHSNGDKWIYAENKNLNNIPFTQNLTLRKNGNFTVGLFDPSFDCAFSGEYKRIGDTIILDKETIDKTHVKMTTIYLLQSGKLVPLFDTVNKITFTIKEIE